MDSRGVVRAIKDGRQEHIERVALRARESFDSGAFHEFFGDDVTLVPLPRSVPFKQKDALWPAMRICRALEARGLCRDVQPLLVRTRPVPKSALQRSAGSRPDPRTHAETLAAKDDTGVLRARICLVDDVVTRGSTLLGAAWCLRRVWPTASVVGFAAVRTMSKQEIRTILDPVEGWIRGDADWVRREP